MTETRPPQQETAPVPPQAEPFGKRVLVVDATELGGLLQALLNRNGIEAAVARTGAAALDSILAAPPMLAIVDLDLPDASAVDLVHILRQPPENVPVVFLASSAKEALPQATQRGVEVAQGFFQKPLHARQLLDHVSRLLGVAQFPSVTPPSGVPLPRPDVLAPRINAPGPDDGGVGPPGLELELEITEELVEVVEEVVEVVEEVEVEVDAEAAAPPPMPVESVEPPVVDVAAPVVDVAPAPAPVADVPAPVPAAAEAAPATTPEAAPAAAVEEPVDLKAMWARKMVEARAAGTTTSSPPTPQKPPTSGSLDATPLWSILDAFYSASESGTLVLRRGQTLRKLGLARGQVALATSNVAGEQPEVILAELGLLPPEGLEPARRDLAPGRAVLGHLVAKELVTRKQAIAVLTEQRTRIVRACFSLRGASYDVQLAPLPPSPLPPLFTGTVILRGVAGTLTLVQLRQELPDAMTLGPRGDGPYPLEKLDLRAEEARLVIACDGTKSVGDLVALSDLSELHVLGLLRGLLALKLVRPVAVQQASRSRGFTFF